MHVMSLTLSKQSNPPPPQYSYKDEQKQEIFATEKLELMTVWQFYHKNYFND